MDLGQAGKGFEMGAIAPGLVQGGKESWGSEVKDGIARACGEVAEGAGDKTFADTGGAAEKHGAVILDPLGGGEIEEDLFMEAPGVTIVDVFDGSLESELGVFEDAGEALVFPVGFFILDEQAHELFVGEV